MGKTEWNYNYPEVRPPQPQAEYQAETSTANTPSSVPRFSWASSLANNEQHRQFSQVNIPPLPAMPENLHRILPAPTPVVGTLLSTRSLPQYQPRTQPHCADEDNQHRHDLSKRQEGTRYQRQSPEIAQRNQFAYMQQWSRQQLQQQQVELQLQQYQPSATSTLPALPRPLPKLAAVKVKTTLDQSSQTSTISPDRNPLSPITSKSEVPTRQTTNGSSTSSAISSRSFTSHSPKYTMTGGSWKYNLFSCAEPTICATGLFCPCILYSRVQHRLQQRSDNQDPTNVLGHDALNSSCVGWSLLCGINGILAGIQKTRVRRAYNMDSSAGNVLGDCFQGCCCCCCVLAQNEKEIKFREEDRRRLICKEGYTSPIRMTFAPPPVKM